MHAVNPPLAVNCVDASPFSTPFCDASLQLLIGVVWPCLYFGVQF